MSKLKSCPFCGGESKVEKVGHRTAPFRIACSRCDASSGFAATEELAALRWDCRSTQAAPVDKRHVGDSCFEGWYSEYAAKGESNPKQIARDAYAAGMGDMTPQPGLPAVVIDEALEIFEDAACKERYHMRDGVEAVMKYCGEESAQKIAWLETTVKRYQNMVDELKQRLAAPTRREEKKAFKVWAKSQKMDLTPFNNTFNSDFTSTAWDGWLARAALTGEQTEQLASSGDAVDVQVLNRLVQILESGRAYNGISQDNAEVYAAALKVILEKSDYEDGGTRFPIEPTDEILQAGFGNLYRLETSIGKNAAKQGYRQMLVAASHVLEVGCLQIDEVISWDRVVGIGMELGMKWANETGWAFFDDDKLHNYANCVAKFARKSMSEALAHEVWSAAQLTPGEGIVDGVFRVMNVLRRQ